MWLEVKEEPEESDKRRNKLEGGKKQPKTRQNKEINNKSAAQSHSQRLFSSDVDAVG